MTRRVDIRSRSRTNILVNLELSQFGLIPGGTTSTRRVFTTDPTTGEEGIQERTIQHPPVVEWRAGQTLTGLPYDILKNPAIGSRLDRTRGRATLVVVREYLAP